MIITATQNLATVAAIIVGGIWAYYRFFKGRTFQPRLEVVVVGTPSSAGDRSYIHGVGRLRNVGLSKVVLDPSVSVLRVLAHSPDTPPTDVDAVEWTHLATVPACENHRWIEPGEVIEDSWLLAVPTIQDGSAFKLELRIAGVATRWLATSIVVAPAATASTR